MKYKLPTEGKLLFDLDYLYIPLVDARGFIKMVSSVYLISVCTSRGAILGLIYYFYCFDLTSYISYFYASMKFHVFLLYVCILEFKGATRPSFSSSYLNMSTGIETRCKFLNCFAFLPLSNPFL